MWCRVRRVNESDGVMTSPVSGHGLQQQPNSSLYSQDASINSHASLKSIINYQLLKWINRTYRSTGSHQNILLIYRTNVLNAENAYRILFVFCRYIYSIVAAYSIYRRGAILYEITQSIIAVALCYIQYYLSIWTKTFFGISFNWSQIGFFKPIFNFLVYHSGPAQCLYLSIWTICF